MLDNFFTIHLVTFGCGEGYERSARRLVRQAKKQNYFASCLRISDSNLEKVLPETKKNISLINAKIAGNKGFGLWFWKPDVILHAMSQTGEGDIVAYLDAGCTLNLKNSKSIARLQDYAHLASINGLFAMQLWDKEFEQPDLTDEFWGFSELNELIEIEDSKLQSNQIQAGILFVKNCPSSRHFMDKWKELMMQEDFKYLVGPQKKEYRYDQSIFSLLYKSSGYPTIPDETYFHPTWDEEGKNFPIWATRINDGVDPFNISGRDLIFRVKRKFLRLTWMWK
jgi:hypothetical protein